MQLHTFVVGALATNCYFLADETSGETLVIDPGAEGARLAEELADRALKPVLLVSTHNHFDHTGGASRLRETFAKTNPQLGTPPYGIGADDVPGLGRGELLREVVTDFQDPPKPERMLHDGEVLQVGGFSVRVVGTPGHTPGSSCFYLPESGLVFTGDTLFQMSIGRYDFPGGNLSQEMNSIRTKLLTLPDATTVYPGHGPSTTIGQEKRLNPFLR